MIIVIAGTFPLSSGTIYKTPTFNTGTTMHDSFVPGENRTEDWLLSKRMR